MRASKVGEFIEIEKEQRVELPELEEVSERLSQGVAISLC
jgi:hypothetical protein